MLFFSLKRRLLFKLILLFPLSIQDTFSASRARPFNMDETDSIFFECSVIYSFSQQIHLKPQFVDTLFIVRLRLNMSMHRAVIINY